MKYIILTIFLTVFKESYPLNPEILKYDSFMKDFEATGRQLKQEKNKEMNSLIVKRDDQNIDTTVKNGEETRAQGFQGEVLEELTGGERGQHTTESLSKTCIQEVCGEKKKFDELTPFEQGEVIGEMDMKYNQVAEYAKDRFCAMNLRSAVEGVRKRSVSFHTDDEKKQNALNSALGVVWDSRAKTLRSVLVNLSNVMSSIQNNPEDKISVEKAKKNFMTTVERLHELDLQFSVEKYDFYKDALIKEILFLNKKESGIFELWKEKHKDFWLGKSSVWKSEKDLNHPGDALIVQKLVKNITVEKTSIKFYTFKELAYLKAIVRAKVEDLELSTQAEQCLWITTAHPESFFSQVIVEVSKISKEYEEFDETEKPLQFCAALGKLYNTLSVDEPHRDAPILPTFCRVGPTDYTKYVQQVSRACPDLRSVGSALIKLTIQDKLFEKTTVKPK